MFTACLLVALLAESPSDAEIYNAALDAKRDAEIQAVKDLVIRLRAALKRPQKPGDSQRLRLEINTAEKKIADLKSGKIPIYLWLDPQTLELGQVGGLPPQLKQGETIYPVIYRVVETYHDACLVLRATWDVKRLVVKTGRIEETVTTSRSVRFVVFDPELGKTMHAGDEYKAGGLWLIERPEPRGDDTLLMLKKLRL